MKRWIKALLLSAAALLVVMVALLYLLIAEPLGLRNVARVLPRVAAGVSFGSVSGRLLDDFELRELLIAGTDGTETRVQSLHLRWDARALWRGQFHVLALDIEGVNVKPSTKPSPPSKGAAEIPTHLPLSIVIDGARLQDLRIESANPFVLDSAQLVGSWIGTRVDIQNLETALPETGPLKLKGAATLASDSIDIESLLLTGPGVVQARGPFGIGKAASQLHVEWSGLRWPLIGDAPAQVEDLHGTADFAGPLDAYTLRLTADARTQKLPLQITLAGKGSQQAFDIAQLQLKSDQGSAQAKGHLGWAPQLAADLSLQLDKLNPGVFAVGWAGELNGVATAKTRADGNPSRIGYTLDIDHSQLRGYPLSLKAKGSVDESSLQIDAATLTAAQGRIDLKGTTAWSPLLRIDAEAQIAQLNPGVFAPRWNGRINGRVLAHTEESKVAAPAAIHFDAHLDQSVLRDYPLKLDTAGSLQGSTVVLEAFKLTSAATTLSASGQVTPPFNAKAELHSPDLAQLYPGASGKLDVSLSAQGAIEEPHVLAHGEGSHLRIGAQSVATLKLDADLDPLKPSKFELKLLNANAGLHISQATLSASGTLAYQQLQFDANTERGDASARLQGGYDTKRSEWGGQLAALKIAPDKLPIWSLEKPVGLLLGPQRLSLEQACVAGDGGRACFAVIRAVLQAGIRTSWNLDAVQLAAFKPLLPRDTTLEGRIDGDGELYWVDGDIGDANATLKLGAGRYAHPGLPAFELQPSTLTLQQQAQRLHAVLALRTAQGTVDADLTAAPAAQFVMRPLSGQVRIHVPDIAFAALFTREVAALSGHIEGDLSVTGTPGAPRLDGRVELADGAARLVSPGIELKDMHVVLSGHGDGPLGIDGSVSSGGGSLKLGGTVDPTSAPPKIDLTVSGDHFLAMSTVDARIFVSPDLTLKTDDSGMHLAGKLLVPEANITPQGFGGGGQAVSADQVIVGEEQAPPKEASKFFATLQLVLGDAVHIAGFGLTTRLTGAVTLNQSPTQATSALGELRLVDGRYKAYGQDLSIDTGRLIFDGGPVTSPAVDIGAYRRPSDEVRVGVRVRGTLDKPQLTLDSQPSMAREQQLSWLLFGRPLEQNSTADRSALSSAAVSLGLSGGGLLAERLGKGIGLDEIQLGTPGGSGNSITGDASTIAGSQAAQGAGSNATGNSAQLTLGKYLTPKLFVSYGVSLFQPGQTFRLLYDLGHGFKLQTESGVANGGDVLYSFERGK